MMTLYTCFDLILLHTRAIFNLFRIDHGDKELNHDELKSMVVGLLGSLVKHPESEYASTGRIMIGKNYDENKEVETVSFYYFLGEMDWSDAKDILEYERDIK